MVNKDILHKSATQQKIHSDYMKGTKWKVSE
jgi:hypothetical protein